MKNTTFKILIIAINFLLHQSGKSQEMCLKVDSIVMYFAPVSTSRLDLTEYDVINFPEHGEKITVKDSALLAEFCNLNLIYQKQTSPNFHPIDCRVVCFCYTGDIMFTKISIDKTGLYSIDKKVYYPKKDFNRWLSNFFEVMFPKENR